MQIAEVLLGLLVWFLMILGVMSVGRWVRPRLAKLVIDEPKRPADLVVMDGGVGCQK